MDKKRGLVETKFMRGLTVEVHGHLLADIMDAFAVACAAHDSQIARCARSNDAKEQGVKYWTGERDRTKAAQTKLYELIRKQKKKIEKL